MGGILNDKKRHSFESEWFNPIADGKWSPAEIIAHHIAWVRFTLEQRLPSVEPNAKLEPFPEFQTVNDAAASYAKSGITKKDLREEFLNVRESVIETFQPFSEVGLSTTLSIGDHQFTILTYMEDFIGHDNHHRKQIEKA